MVPNHRRLEVEEFGRCEDSELDTGFDEEVAQIYFEEVDDAIAGTFHKAGELLAEEEESLHMVDNMVDYMD